MRWPQVLLAGVISGLLAAAGAWLALGDSQPGDDSVGDALAAELRALREEVSALREAVAQGPAEPRAPTSAEPGSLVDPHVEEQRSQLDQFARRQQELVDGLARLEGGVADLASRLSASLGEPPLPETLPDTPPDLARLGALRGQSMTQLSEQHMYWDYARVLAEYGRPDRIGPSPDGKSITFTYEWSDGDAFIVRFRQGRAFAAFWRL